MFDEANSRGEPIPIYAEMANTNPIFIIKNKRKELTETLINSVHLSVGQFSTSPGLVFISKSLNGKGFEFLLANRIENSISGTKLTPNIQMAYYYRLEKLKSKQSVRLISKGKSSNGHNQGVSKLNMVSGEDFIIDIDLEKEIFGPPLVLVKTECKTQMFSIVHKLHGHLTATIHGTEKDLIQHKELLRKLERKAGRIVINGYPIGVEACYSMLHSGLFPATTDSRTTSAESGAITRFTRPMCLQNFLNSLLPKELKLTNPINISRIENGKKITSN